jgi:hypothetical protein
LEEMRAALIAEETRRAEEERQRKERKAAEEVEYRDAWRTDPTMYTQGMQNLPPALRLANKDPEGKAGNMIVQTSRGAEIPVSDALKLWPVIVSVKAGARLADDALRLVRRLGVYNLTTIRPDGSIVVGCHDIAWCEIEYIAVALELIKEYRVAVRGKSSGRAETLTMRTWPKMNVQQEAARLAASYGADVESVTPVLSEEVAA